MSRSFQRKYLSWGKSKAGKMSRKGKNWSVKRNANGKVERKNHWLASLQTLDQYIYYVRNHFFCDKAILGHGNFNDRYDRKNWKDYKTFLAEREETEELIKEFAIRLFNKARSK